VASWGGISQVVPHFARLSYLLNEVPVGIGDGGEIDDREGLSWLVSFYLSLRHKRHGDLSGEFTLGKQGGEGMP
jgi:hypothetical protein